MRKITRPGLDNLLRNCAQLRSEVGTPFYAYDRASILNAVSFLLTSASQAGVVKPNFNVAFFALPNAVLFHDIIGSHPNLGINCNSFEEILALQMSGWKDWNRVVFTGGVVPKQELLAIADSGCLINAASKGNLEILLQCSSACKIGLRLDLSDNALKGIRLSELDDCMSLAARHGKQIIGLHSYPGTEVEDLSFLVRHARLLMKIARKYPHIKEINFGGGFFYDYDHLTGDIADMADLQQYFSELKRICDHNLEDEFRLCWEPGRVIFAGAGFFATEIIEVRKTGVNTADVYVDASFTQIPSMKIRNRQHQIVIIDQNGLIQTSRDLEARICGATTLSTDQILPLPCLMPEVVPGDLIVILDVGAYGRAGSYNFLGKAKPPEVLMGDASWRVIRKRQPSDHLLEGLDLGGTPLG